MQGSPGADTIACTVRPYRAYAAGRLVGGEASAGRTSSTALAIITCGSTDRGSSHLVSSSVTATHDRREEGAGSEERGKGQEEGEGEGEGEDEEAEK